MYVPGHTHRLLERHRFAAPDPVGRAPAATRRWNARQPGLRIGRQTAESALPISTGKCPSSNTPRAKGRAPVAVCAFPALAEDHLAEHASVAGSERAVALRWASVLRGRKADESVNRRRAVGGHEVLIAIAWIEAVRAGGDVL